jgi:ATP-dependent protease ClpP protease subunit
MSELIRKVIESPRGTDGLFIQPSEVGPDRELVENRNRLNFANNFSYADQWTGNTRTFDPEGRYNCGACNKANGDDCLLISIAIDRQAGSCRHWENLCAGDPELDMAGVETPDLASYGVAENGKGFGCHRCPFAVAAIATDSRGRDLYCAKGDFRTGGDACCQLNGAEVLEMPKLGNTQGKNQHMPPRCGAPAGRQNAAKPRFSAALQANGVLELMVYGDIVNAATISMLEAWGYSTDGFVSALNVKRALDEGGEYASVRVRINSPGGDAFEGIAIHALLSSAGKSVETLVDGIAASAASIIAMAGSTRTMGRSAMMMIHDAWTYGSGNSRDFRKLASTLDKIDGSIAEAYVARTGKPASEIRALMNAETWMSAQDCVDGGFATAIAQEPNEEEEAAAMAMARGFKTLAKLKHVPDNLRDPAAASPNASNDNDCDCDCEACKDNRCQECSNEDCDDPNCKDCPMQEESAAASAPLAPAAASNLTLMQSRQWEMEHGIR